MKDKLRIAIIGFGRIGKIHYQNLSKRGEVSAIAICDPKADRIKESYSDDVAFYSDYETLMGDFLPGALLICSPTPTHVDIISQCFDRGIHVFCEKPIDLNISVIQGLLERSEKGDTICFVGFNRRFDPDFAHLQQQIAAGVIGDIHQVTITSRDPGLPPMEYIASSGGMFMDMTIHDFDMARFLTGSEVVEVYAKGRVMIDPELHKYDDIDTATTVLTMRNGATCTILNSRSAVYGYDQRIEVFGEKGALLVDNKPVHRVQLWDSTSQQQSNPEPFFLERYAQSYEQELASFLSAIGNKGQAHVGIIDALAATQIAVAAIESVRAKSAILMPD